MKIKSIVERMANDTSTLEEGVMDKTFLKAIYMTGGPGSGKSYIVDKTMKSFGFKVINSDERLVKYLKDAGISLKFKDNPHQRAAKDMLRHVATQRTAQEKKFRTAGQQGIIIDTTGFSVEKVKKHYQELQDCGYDILLVFVETALETALERNHNRSRSLDDNTVESYWNKIMGNKSQLLSLFGNDSVVVDNNDGNQAAVAKLYKDVMKFVNAPIKNPIGQELQQQQLDAKKRI